MPEPKESTLGQILVNRLLPEEYRDYNKTLYKKDLMNLLMRLANERGDEFKDTMFKLSQLSLHAQQENGGFSFSLPHMLKSPTAVKYESKFKEYMQSVLSNDMLTPQEKQKKIVDYGVKISKVQKEELLKEQLDKRNPIALAVVSGAKGSPANANSLLGSDYFYVNYSGEPVPFPVLHSYGEGLTPTEYSAGSYGARRGVADEKLAIRDTGALAKDLVRIVHRQMVTGIDGTDADESIGYGVDVDDTDSIGSLLARQTGPYPRNTIITNKILNDLENKGIKKLLVRSPIIGGAPDGGMYARDIGMREKNRLPVIGENPAIAAAQSMAEPLTQGALSSKHTGGVYGVTSKAVSGFKNIKQLLEVPEVYMGGATHSDDDGKVTDIVAAPAGGYIITIAGKDHFVPQGLEPIVKKGQTVEAGDVLSSGLPNPKKIVEHKGIGEGRAYFIKTMRDTFKDSDLKMNRRNIELLSRSLINHVQINDFYNNLNPGEIVPYSTFAASYKPSEDAKSVDVSDSCVNSYLEKPVLHYTIGTKIRPSIINNLKEYGIKSILVSKNAPPFTPRMLSSRGFLKNDPDWLTKMYGSHITQGFLDSVATSASSDTKGTSFVPGLAFDPHFGEQGKVKSLSGPLSFKPISLS